MLPLSFHSRFAVVVSISLVFPHLLSAASGGSFVNIGDMTMARIAHGVALLPDGKVLIAGGFSVSQDTSSAEIYDPVARTFTATGSMASPREFCGQADAPVPLTNGQVLVVGGRNAATYLSTAELYDETTGTFTATGPMSTARYCPTVTRLADGTVLVAGGFGQSFSSLNTAEIYDPASGAFSPTAGGLNTARGGAIGSLLQDGNVLIVEGSGNTKGSLTTSEIYLPSSGTFQNTGTTPVGVALPLEGVAQLNNGKVLVTGFSRINPARLYDPATGVFSETGAEPFVTYGETDITLNNGNVINIGPTGHLYVTSSGQFIDGPAMIAPDSAAILLKDGTVLVCGGIISSTVRRAGLYVPS